MRRVRVSSRGSVIVATSGESGRLLMRIVSALSRWMPCPKCIIPRGKRFGQARRSYSVGWSARPSVQLLGRENRTCRPGDPCLATATFLCSGYVIRARVMEGPAMPERPFVHLHCHSHYSLLDGANRIPELVAHVKRLGMNALALTDHGNLYGAI